MESQIVRTHLEMIHRAGQLQVLKFDIKINKEQEISSLSSLLGDHIHIHFLHGTVF
jgi:hypothetical protein